MARKNEIDLDYLYEKTPMRVGWMGERAYLAFNTNNNPNNNYRGYTMNLPVVKGLIRTLQGIEKAMEEKGEVKKAETGRGGGKSRAVQQTPLGGKAGPSREERAQKAHSKSERKRLEVMREADQSRARVRSGKRNERTK